MKKIILTTIILAISFYTLTASNLNNNTPGPSFKFPSTLINFNKLQTSQSLSFTSIMSSESKPIFISNFQNRFSYNLSHNLQLQLDLNIVNYRNANVDDNFSIKDNSRVLPNFRLDYSPSENFHLRLEYNSFPGYYSPFSR